MILEPCLLESIQVESEDSISFSYFIGFGPVQKQLPNYVQSPNCSYDLAYKATAADSDVSVEIGDRGNLIVNCDKTSLDGQVVDVEIDAFRGDVSFTSLIKI